MGMMIYLLLLLCVIIYCGKIIYKNYQEERPLGYGQNKTLHFVIVLCIIVGQYMIPSVVERLIVILLFDFAFFLIYTMIGLHNKKNHSGELFLRYKREVGGAKIGTYIAAGVVFLALFLSYFLE